MAGPDDPEIHPDVPPGEAAVGQRERSLLWLFGSLASSKEWVDLRREGGYPARVNFRVLDLRLI